MFACIKRYRFVHSRMIIFPQILSIVKKTMIKYHYTWEKLYDSSEYSLNGDDDSKVNIL